MTWSYFFLVVCLKSEVLKTAVSERRCTDSKWCSNRETEIYYDNSSDEKKCLHCLRKILYIINRFYSCVSLKQFCSSTAGKFFEDATVCDLCFGFYEHISKLGHLR